MKIINLKMRFMMHKRSKAYIKAEQPTMSYLIRASFLVVAVSIAHIKNKSLYSMRKTSKKRTATEHIRHLKLASISHEQFRDGLKTHLFLMCSDAANFCKGIASLVKKNSSTRSPLKPNWLLLVDAYFPKKFICKISP